MDLMPPVEELRKHIGEWVAIHEGKIVNTGLDRMATRLGAMAKLGSGEIPIMLFLSGDPNRM